MLTSKQAAQYLGISVYYLRNMRQSLHNHDGPSYTYIKPERIGYPAVFYAKEDLDAWKAKHVFKKDRGMVKKLTPRKKKHRSDFLDDWIY